jgi:hypothetical protein
MYKIAEGLDTGLTDTSTLDAQISIPLRTHPTIISLPEIRITFSKNVRVSVCACGNPSPECRSIGYRLSDGRPGLATAGGFLFSMFCTREERRGASLDHESRRKRNRPTTNRQTGRKDGEKDHGPCCTGDIMSNRNLLSFSSSVPRGITIFAADDGAGCVVGSASSEINPDSGHEMLMKCRIPGS